jgi:hypothetical protein
MNWPRMTHGHCSRKVLRMRKLRRFCAIGAGLDLALKILLF